MNNSILIIDDDPDILKVLKANLELYDFKVTTAASWSEGQSLIAAKLPDLVILDLMLPDVDGFEISRILKKQYPALPLIMLTAKNRTSDKVVGLESGADDYVVKPFETLELIARIKACLRRVAPVSEDMITVRNLTIDFRRRLVRVKNREVILTSKEYDLLCFLVSKKGVVVSREEIRKHLWKEPKIRSWSRVIDVHIQHIRQKIEDDPSEPEYITTFSGVGYRFNEQ